VKEGAPTPTRKLLGSHALKIALTEVFANDTGNQGSAIRLKLKSSMNWDHSEQTSRKENSIFINPGFLCAPPCSLDTFAFHEESTSPSTKPERSVVRVYATKESLDRLKHPATEFLNYGRKFIVVFVDKSADHPRFAIIPRCCNSAVTRL
jgi:hypothetical protein